MTSDRPTMPIVSNCDRTAECPSSVDHDSRCPKYDAEFWAKVQVRRPGDQAPEFPTTAPSVPAPAADGGEVAHPRFEAFKAKVLANPEVRAAYEAVVLAAHSPRTHPPMGLVVGCSCGWRIGRTMYEGYDTHVAAAILTSDWLADLRRTERAEGAREALRIVRLVEGDMSETALKAWRSADARRGLSDHDALLAHADVLTRWSERFRMAFNGDDYREDRAASGAGQ